MKDIDCVDERREFLRVDYEAPIEVSIFTNDMVSQIPQGMTKNVSACGVLFTSKQPVTIGTLIVVTLESHTLNDVVEIDDSVINVNDRLVGRIVRVEEMIPEKEFDIGVCFVRDRDSDADDIQKIVKIIT